jgi:hypothetical protein
MESRPMWRRLVPLGRRPEAVKSFERDVEAAGGVVGRVDAGLHVVPTARIVGSLDRWRTLRADFLPMRGPRVTERHRRVADAMRRGVPLPPLELYAVRPRRTDPARAAAATAYYVVDGHHRVAMARRLGQDFLDAHVVEYRVAR